MLRLLRLLALVCLAAASPVFAQEADLVRVRLFGGQALRAVTLSATDAPLTVRADGLAVGTLAPGQRAEVVLAGGRLEVRLAGRVVPATHVALGDAEAAVHVGAGRTVRRYPGAIHATAAGDRLQIVNHAPLEPYVASVVAAEYPFQEIEGVKAQAILARTYALRHQGSRGSYDVEDSEASQVYRGLEGVTPVARRAAEETRGVVLTYGGRLTEATYFSSSGGHTASNESVWGTAPLPYLRGIPDPYDQQSPNYRWTVTAPAARVHAALSQRFGGAVTGFSVESRSPEGRVVHVRLHGARRDLVSGNDFRLAVNAVLGARTLRSTLFEVAMSGDAYRFEGGGFGHGVGMSQYGARGRAQAGYSAEQILAAYFGGTSLSLYDRGAVSALGAELARHEPTSGRRPTPRSQARAGAPAPPVGAPSREPAAWSADPTLPPVVIADEGPRRRPTPRAQAAAEAAAREPAEETPAARRTGW